MKVSVPLWASMMMLMASTTVFASGSANDIVKGKGYATTYACNTQLKKAGKFCKGISTYSCWCSNEVAMASMAGCFNLFDRMTPEAVTKLDFLCRLWGGVNTTLTYDQFVKSYDYYLENAKFPSEIPGYNKLVITKIPLKVNVTAAKFYDQGATKLGNMYDDSLWYGAGLLGYWAAILMLATLVNWSYIIFPRMFKGFNGSISNWFRRHFVLASTFGQRNSTAYSFMNVKFASGLVPLRWESLVLLVFVILTAGFSGAGVHAIKNDPLFSKEFAISHYVADRTGTILMYLVPLMILFAGRNNFLQWMTGWHYDTFIMFHRWISRVAFLLIVAHAGAYSYFFDNRYAMNMEENYMIWGAVSTVAGGLLLLQGMLYLRRNAYEWFHFIHIVLAVVFIMGAWIHIDYPGYGAFAYPCVAIWGCDWVVRIVRCIGFGFPKAKMSIVADDLIKVEVKAPCWWRATASAGSHAFIYFLTPVAFMQSHPLSTMVSPHDPSNIVMYVKVKSGLTKTIYKKLLNNGNSMVMRVTLEGPYGHGASIAMHDTVAFIASGVGIPGIYAELYDAACKSRFADRKLNLYWIINNTGYIQALNEELDKLKEFSNVSITVYVTSGRSKAINEKVNDDKDDSEISLEFSMNSSYAIMYDRPDIGAIVRREITQCNKAVAFVSCSNHGMSDLLRKSIQTSLETGKRVDYFDELQVWA